MKRLSWVKVAATAVFSILLLTGCASDKAARVVDEKVNLAEAVDKASAGLLRQSSKGLNKSRIVLATSFVNIDDLQQSSTFGRLLGDTIAGNMVGRGYNVVEVRLRNSLSMQPRVGEYMLSRELQNVGTQHDAQAVLVGTYAIGGDYVYVNARLVSVMDSRVLSSNDFRLPLNRDIRKMLTSGR
ncbi:FlgO family outer membrane protein [Neptunomonas sp.]|uniref:FlgO family outer membrane protein n=1 Tax=Neptunomonas sp. TaxID=1971898 RepID=UPI0025F89BD3|nr:FlgO family outer membrane protein [Neptunomonas sp.]